MRGMVGGSWDEGGEFRDFGWSDSVCGVGQYRGGRTIVVKGQLLWFTGVVAGSGEYKGGVFSGTGGFWLGFFSLCSCIIV